MRELDVIHPAAKIIVMNATQQEAEMGDGTNLVVVLAGEFLQKAEQLLRMGLHPSDVVDGYQAALQHALTILDELAVHTVGDVGDVSAMGAVLRPVLAAKQHGYEDVLAPLVARACVHALPPTGGPFNVDNVRVVKVEGGGVGDASLVQGMVLPRAPEGRVRQVTNARVAVFAGGIDAAKTETKGTVLLNNAEELLNYTRGEEQQIEELVKAVVASGVTVVVSGGAIGELAKHYFELAGVLIIKAPSKFELRRICQTCRATPLLRLGAPTADELGKCRAVACAELGGKTVTYFRQDDGSSRIATLVARGATQNILDNVATAIDDGVNCFKATCRDPRFVAGAGAAEIELARRLALIADKAPGMEQYAIRKFAESFEVVASTLGETCGLDPTKTVSDLYAAHEQPDGAATGVLVDDATLGDALKAGVYDHLLTKRSAIQLAVDAALTLLKTDQIIMSRRAGGPVLPRQGPRDGD